MSTQAPSSSNVRSTMKSGLEGPIVVCLVDGLGDGELVDELVRLLELPTYEQAVRREREAAPSSIVKQTLAKTSLVRMKLESAGTALGQPAGRSGDARVGYEAMFSSEGPRHDPSGLRERFAASDRALFGSPPLGSLIDFAERFSGRFVTDFFTQRDRPECAVHLFAYLSERGPHGDVGLLHALVDELADRELPLRVHAIVDGRDDPPRKAWRLVEPLVEQLEGKGLLASLAGSDYLFPAENDWDRTLELWRAIVRGDEVKTAATAYDALSEAYEEGLTDRTIEPVRIGDYDGMGGELSAEIPSEMPAWRWLGSDVGVVASLRGDTFAALVRALMRGPLPSVVEDRLTVRGRPVIAFEPHRIASFVPIVGAPSCLGVASSSAALDVLGALEAAGRKVLVIAAETRRSMASEHIARGVATEPSLVVEPNDQCAIEEASRRATSEPNSVLVVCLGALDDALHTGSRAAAFDAIRQLASPLATLAKQVVSTGGTLVVTAAHAGAEALVEGDDAARGHSAGAVPLLAMVGPEIEPVARDESSLLDVGPTLCALAGIDAPGACRGHVLLRRSERSA